MKVKKTQKEKRPGKERNGTRKNDCTNKTIHRTTEEKRKDKIVQPMRYRRKQPRSGDKD